jgi:hypothetical protein
MRGKPSPWGLRSHQGGEVPGNQTWFGSVNWTGAMAGAKGNESRQNRVPSSVVAAHVHSYPWNVALGKHVCPPAGMLLQKRHGDLHIPVPSKEPAPQKGILLHNRR